jgi:hypothetical protein
MVYFSTVRRGAGRSSGVVYRRQVVNLLFFQLLQSFPPYSRRAHWGDTKAENPRVCPFASTMTSFWINDFFES